MNQYNLLKFLYKIISKIPKKILLKLAEPIGLLWYKVDKYHRNIAIENMKIAFNSEMNIQSMKGIAKNNFIHFARMALELFYLLKLNKKNVDSYVIFSGEKNLKKALSKDKGIIIISAHLGNWELMALATPLQYSISLNLTARQLDFMPFDRLINEIRSNTGNIIVDKDNSASLMGKLLSGKKIVAVMLDQSASWFEGVYVPFFKKIACTNKSVALLALRYDAIVLPVFNIRQNDGRYKVIIDEPVSLKRTGNIKKDVIENTILFNKIIENHIRIAPENWFWVHRRWRIKDPEIANKIIEKDYYFVKPRV